MSFVSLASIQSAWLGYEYWRDKAEEYYRQWELDESGDAYDEEDDKLDEREHQVIRRIQHMKKDELQ